MKKFLKFFSIGLLISANLHAGSCTIVSSPASNVSILSGTDSISLDISTVYYNKKKQMKFKTFSDAYMEFYQKAQNYIQNGCKKYKITKIYNFQVHSIVSEHAYHFYATYDF